MEQLSFGVRENHGRIAEQAIRLDEVEGLACAGTADDDDIVVQSRPMRVQAHPDMLGQNLVHGIIRVRQFFIYLTDIRKPGCPEFLAGHEIAVMSGCLQEQGEPDQQACRDGFDRPVRYCERKWMKQNVQDAV